MKSVWDSLAKMPEKDREKYLSGGKSPQNKAIRSQKSFGGVTYSQTRIVAPETGLQWRGGPGWDEA